MEKDKTPHGTFTQLPNVFIDLCDISDEAYRLYTKLFREYGTRGGVYTGSLRKLADLLTMNKDKVHRNLRALAAATLLTMNTTNNQLTVTLNVDDLWQLNILAKLGEHIPRWTNLKETLTAVSNLRQERLKNETALSQNCDNNDESVSDLRQPEEDIKPPVEQDKRANSEGRNTDDTKTNANTGKNVAHRSDLLSSEQNRIDGYYYQCTKRRPRITDDLKGYWDALISDITNQEDMTSLYEFVQKKCANLPDPRVHPGNLVSYLEAWKQEHAQLPWTQPDTTADSVEEPETGVPMFAGQPLSYWTEDAMEAANFTRTRRNTIRRLQAEMQMLTTYAITG